MNDFASLFFATDKVDATTCKATFQSPDHIELCHGQSRPGDPYKCTNGWQGFVLEQLVIAPRSQSYTDCGPFHNNDLYGAQCMRDLVHQKEDFDRVVFDILDKVSGQNQIAQSTAVERFSLAGDAAVGDKEMVAAWTSSAFVSFEKKCKPGRSTFLHFFFCMSALFSLSLFFFFFFFFWRGGAFLFVCFLFFL